MAIRTASHYDIGYDMLFAVDDIMQGNKDPEEMGKEFWEQFVLFVEKYNLADVPHAAVEAKVLPHAS
jgi:hypothetical protein